MKQLNFKKIAVLSICVIALSLQSCKKDDSPEPATIPNKGLCEIVWKIEF